ncbi:hypothetical protein [Streptomyces sp. NPDC047928]|uniref:hypothetical protein n=1 Tax=unclassified Streptomyces TaxID=2593676 RepID=UPI003719D3EB
MIDVYRAQAKAALEDRAKLIHEIRSVESDSNLSGSEKRERVERLDRDVMRLEAEAREAVQRGEREAEVRSLIPKDAGILTPNKNESTDSEEWRGMLPSLEPASVQIVKAAAS